MNQAQPAVVIRTGMALFHFGNNFVKTMIRLGQERDSLGVVFDQIGTPTYANDLARPSMLLLIKGIVRGILPFQQ